MQSKIITLIFLLLTLLMSVLVRTLNFSNLEQTHVLDADSARYLRYTQIFVEDGTVPEQDRQRRYPVGVSQAEQLLLFPWLLATLYRLFAVLFPWVDVEHLSAIYPLLFSTLSWLVLFFLIARLLDKEVALLCVNISVWTLPILHRSVAGNLDRDLFCLFLALASYYFFVRSYQTQIFVHRLIFSVTSGVIMALLGLTWQGVGLFTSIIVCFYFIQFGLNTYRKSEFFLYLLWLVPIALGLLWARKVYAFTYAHTLLVVLPLFLLTLVSILGFLVSQSSRLSLIFTLNRKVLHTLGIILTSIGFGILLTLIFVVVSSDTFNILSLLFDNFLSPFGSNRIIDTILELQKPHIRSLIIWPGYFFFLFAGGAFLLMKRLASGLQLNVGISLILFEFLIIGIVFSRVIAGITDRSETTLSILLYILPICLFFIGMTVMLLRVGWKKVSSWEQSVQLDQNALFLLVYSTILLMCVRGAIRFEFFWAPFAIALGAYALIELLRIITKHLRYDHLILYLLLIILCWEFYALGNKSFLTSVDYIDKLFLGTVIILTTFFLGFVCRALYHSLQKYRVFYMGAFSGLVILIISLTSLSPSPLFGGYASFNSEKVLRIKPVINQNVAEALRWLRTNTPKESVIAAWWDYGSWINLIADRTTIIDEEQVLDWVYLMARHVMSGQTTKETISFLESHQATHLLLSSRNIEVIDALSAIGSDQAMDRFFNIPIFTAKNELIESRYEGTIYRFLPHLDIEVHSSFQLKKAGDLHPNWKIDAIYLKVNQDDSQNLTLNGAVITLKNQAGVLLRLKPERILFENEVFLQEGKVLPCTLLIHSKPKNPLDWKIIYLSEKAQSALAIRLYLLKQHLESFTPVYPPTTEDFESAPVKIWQVNYPEVLNPDGDEHK